MILLNNTVLFNSYAFGGDCVILHDVKCWSVYKCMCNFVYVYVVIKIQYRLLCSLYCGGSTLSNVSCHIVMCQYLRWLLSVWLSSDYNYNCSVCHWLYVGRAQQL